MPRPIALQPRIHPLLDLLIRDDDGSQLIEYGLLAAIIGLAGLLVLSTFSGTMAAAYDDWNTDTQDAWEPCPPQPQLCP